MISLCENRVACGLRLVFRLTLIRTGTFASPHTVLNKVVECVLVSTVLNSVLNLVCARTVPTVRL